MMKTNLIRSSGIFAGNTFLSRILGFARDMLIGALFGVSAGTDAFYVAFKIPNFMRRLFAEGAFSQSFVPILSEYETQKTSSEIKQFINAMFGVLAGVLLVVTVLAMLLSPWLVHVFAPGFKADTHQFHLAAEMLRITFPYLFFISLTAFAAAILNTHQVFGPPAFTPVLLNISLIAFALLGAHHFHAPVMALAWGVFVAGVVQLLFQIPFLLKVKRMPRPTFSLQDPGVRRVLTLMLPALFGVSVSQINLLMDTVFASFLSVGSVSWLYYSSRLMNFPLGVFGVAIATVILPTLSKQHATQDDARYAATLDWAIRSILLISLPATLGLLILSGPLLSTLFHYGHFQLNDVLMSQASLITFAVGVPAFMLVKVLVSGFYSKQNMKTPVKIGAIAMISNILLNAMLMGPLAHAGLALATSISAVLNAGLLFYVLRRDNIYQAQPGWNVFILRLMFANFVMGGFLILVTPQLSAWLTLGWQWRAAHLGFIVIAAALLYLGSLRLMGLRLKDFKQQS